MFIVTSFHECTALLFTEDAPGSLFTFLVFYQSLYRVALAGCRLARYLKPGVTIVGLNSQANMKK